MGARDLLAELQGAGFALVADGSRLIVRPASKLTDELRATLRDSKAELLALVGDEATAARKARLLRLGWPESEAAAVAERLARRDREQDERRLCTECASFRPGRCTSHRRAGLLTAEIGRRLAALPQRCTGFIERGDA